MAQLRIAKDELHAQKLEALCLEMHKIHLENINKYPEQWLQWRDIGEEIMPGPYEHERERARFIDEKLHLIIPIGPAYIVAHMLTHRHMEIPKRVMFCLRKSKNSSDFLIRVGQLRFSYSAELAFKLVEILEGKLELTMPVQDEKLQLPAPVEKD